MEPVTPDISCFLYWGKGKIIIERLNVLEINYTKWRLSNV